MNTLSIVPPKVGSKLSVAPRPLLLFLSLYIIPYMVYKLNRLNQKTCKKASDFDVSARREVYAPGAITAMVIMILLHSHSNTVKKAGLSRWIPSRALSVATKDLSR